MPHYVKLESCVATASREDFVMTKSSAACPHMGHPPFSPEKAMPRKAEIGATRDSHIYRVRVPVELQEQWEAWCARTDKKPSEVMRALMRYIVQDDMPAEVRDWIAAQAAGQPDDGPKERIEVRLTPTEYQCVTTRAEAEGCSPTRWIINCVRASLTHEPQFTMEATRALWESSYQLRSIGRNLNQITKRLNEGGRVSLKAEQIEKLATYIYRHTDKVAAVQDASLSRWKLDIEPGGKAAFPLPGAEPGGSV